MNLIVFPSARRLTAEACLDKMVTKARALAALGPVDFDQAIWSVSMVKTKRPSSARANVNTLYFTQVAHGKRAGAARVPLKEPFASFLKAAVRLREDGRCLHFDNHSTMITAGRLLHNTMRYLEYRPCYFSPNCFHEAATVARRRYARSTAYSIGKMLVELAEIANTYKVASLPIYFRNPNPRDEASNARIGPAADKRREDKLPGKEALDALATIANLVEQDADVLRMRCVELLACGAWRINEILSIASDCEVEEAAYEGGKPVLDAQGRHVVRYGIVYYGEKGAPPLPKWIPTPMVDLAKRAVADIRRITQPCRDTLAWMDDNPGFLPIDGLRSFETHDRIRLRDLGKTLGVAWPRDWCEKRNVPIDGRTVAKRDVAYAVRSALPRVPDGLPFKLEEFLFLIPFNMMREGCPSVPGAIRFVTDDMIASFLGATDSRSVFVKFDMRDKDGKPFRINSHRFRHWLNTLAQEGGMDQHLIARWSGRKDVGQNDAYDHVTGAQLAERIREVVKAGNVRGPVAEAIKALGPVQRDDFLKMQFATAHVTEIGMCVHDWSLTPCLSHGACAGCDEHVVTKGDAKQRAEAERLLRENRFLLEKAELEVGETYGASRWVETQRRTVAGLMAIVAAHDDGSIPDGAIVHLGTIAGRDAR